MVSTSPQFPNPRNTIKCNTLSKEGLGGWHEPGGLVCVGGTNLSPSAKAIAEIRGQFPTERIFQTEDGPMKKILVWVFVTFIVALAAWAIYEMGAASFGGDPGAKRAPRGWTTHKGPAGFSVNLPEAWSARSDRATGRVEIQGDAGEQMVVWPVFIPAALDAPSASSVLSRLRTPLTGHSERAF